MRWFLSTQPPGLSRVFFGRKNYYMTCVALFYHSARFLVRSGSETLGQLEFFFFGLLARHCRWRPGSIGAIDAGRCLPGQPKRAGGLLGSTVWRSYLLQHSGPNFRRVDKPIILLGVGFFSSISRLASYRLFLTSRLVHRPTRIYRRASPDQSFR